MADEIWDPDPEFLDWMETMIRATGALDYKCRGGQSQYTYREAIALMRAGTEKWARDMYRAVLKTPSYPRFLRWKGQKDREEGG